MENATRPHAEYPSSTPGPSYSRSSRFPVNPLLILILLVVSFGAVVVYGVYRLSAVSITLIIEGVRNEVRTHQPTVGEMLREQQVLLEVPDILVPTSDTPITPGMVISIDKAQPVLISVDDDPPRRVLTHKTAPRDILIEQGVTLDLHDAIIVDGLPLTPDQVFGTTPSSIQIIHALTVKIADGTTLITRYTITRTVGEVLNEAQIPLFLADQVTPDFDTPLTNGLTITVQRSVPITIREGGQELATRTHGTNVREALAESGMALIGLDYALPGEDTPIVDGLTIQIVRVTEEDEIERQEIDFKHLVQTTTDLPPDTERIVQEGLKGLMERRIRVRREDGIEVSRSLPVEVIVRDARDEILAVGATPAMIGPNGEVATPIATATP